MENLHQNLIDILLTKKFDFEQFVIGVEAFFRKHPSLNSGPLPIIHSLKSRIKDISHIEDKLARKEAKGELLTVDNIFSSITDIVGVRVLHLHQDQFRHIHEAIMQKINSGDWHLFEPPMAYTWDPESEQFYKDLGFETKLRETYYTSIHYVVKPNAHNPITCEIQVRTLFEEIWGEIDHTINYPNKTKSIACSEQLRVLSKLVSTGTRLADSIFKTVSEHQSLTA